MNLLPRSAVGAALVAACLYSHGVAGGYEPIDHRAVVRNRAPLAETPLLRLPVGSVRPQGWLLRQLELQQQGLTGAAEQLYDALLPNSGWLGGDGDGWEKAPYYTKGLLALAYTLDDGLLKQRSQKWIEWVLASQGDDGFFGPRDNDDWWPRMVVVYYLRDYYEATGDSRVVPFLLGYFRHQLDHLPQRPLRDWGRARAGDNIEIVLWTYNLTGEAWLLDLAGLLQRQAYPWSDIYTNNQFYGRFDEFHPHHIVNVSQALKFPPVVWQLTHRDTDKAAYSAGIANLERQYGRIDGQVSGTEMLSGRSSTDGVELCADVERIVSTGVAARILGDATLGDQLERVAYNSLPAHTTAELTGITYYQLQNQVRCVHTPHGFSQDYPNGIVPGPYSGFPCCCYNWHMGWPKLVENLWAATADGGLAAVAYGPCAVTAKVTGGATVAIDESTDYPFRETIRLAVTIDQPTEFPLLLRIPGWCEGAVVLVNGQQTETTATPGTHERITRVWQTGDTVELTLPMRVRTSRWVNNSLGVERGPLAFGLEIDQQWHKTADYQGPFDEFTVTPASPWNYALAVDHRQPGQSFQVEVRDVGDVPWDLDAAPVVLTATARRLPEWGLKPALGRVEIGRADHAWHPIAQQAIPLEPGVPHRLRAQVDGGRFQVYVDDAKQAVLEARDGTFAKGGIGLRTYQTAAQFDDVRLNGKLLDDFEQGIDSWQTYDATWKLRDGRLVVDKCPTAKAVKTDVAVGRRFALEATVQLAPDGNAGLVFRTGDMGPGADAYQGYYVGIAASQTQPDAAEPPESPVVSAQSPESVRLVPFGSTKLRVVYFPVLAE